MQSQGMNQSKGVLPLKIEPEEMDHVYEVVEDYAKFLEKFKDSDQNGWWAIRTVRDAYKSKDFEAFKKGVDKVLGYLE